MSPKGSQMVSFTLSPHACLRVSHEEPVELQILENRKYHCEKNKSVCMCVFVCRCLSVFVTHRQTTSFSVCLCYLTALLKFLLLNFKHRFNHTHKHTLSTTQLCLSVHLCCISVANQKFERCRRSFKLLSVCLSACQVPCAVVSC